MPFLWVFFGCKIWKSDVFIFKCDYLRTTFLCNAAHGKHQNSKSFCPIHLEIWGIVPYGDRCEIVQNGTKFHSESNFSSRSYDSRNAAQTVLEYSNPMLLILNCWTSSARGGNLKRFDLYIWPFKNGDFRKIV